MGGTTLLVDVGAVWFYSQTKSSRAQAVKHHFGNMPSASVRAIESHSPPLEGMNPKRNESAYVAISARNVIDGTADLFLESGG